MNYPIVRLGDVAEIEREGVNPAVISAATNYVGLEHIASDGSISEMKKVDPGDLASTKFAFTERHVLFGKLRPYLRKTARPSFSGICSTDIIPIVPSKQLTRDYLFHFLRTDEIVSKATAMSSGANLPRISPKHLVEFEIPIPSLNEQRRITAILDQVDELRQLRRRTIDSLDDLELSSFVTLFGLMEAGSTKWPLAPLFELVTDSMIGLVRSAAELGPDLPVPYIRMNALTRNGKLDLSDLDFTTVSATEQERYRLERGDFLFNTRNSKELVGKSAIFDSAGLYVFNNNILRLRFQKEIEPRYIAHAFRMPAVASAIELCKSGTTSVFAIYWKSLKNIQVPVPPKAIQQKFAAISSAIEGERRKFAFNYHQLSSLFASVQHLAFTGDL